MKSGFVGGILDADGYWRWDAGPEAGQRFWRGGPLGLGIRKSDAAEILPYQLSMQQVDLANPTAHWRKQPLWHEGETAFHYTGFSAGAPGPASCAAGGFDCQPQLSLETNRLAVFGGTGAGQWFAVKDNFLSCRGNDIDSLCGYYVEWGGMPGDPDVTTALTETINIAAHRRHCRID